MFEENGPFRVIDDGEQLTLHRRQHSWNNVAHMLYIDQPVGTGLSYVNGSEYLNSNEEQVAEHMYTLLQTFYDRHPEYRKLDLYLSGESYAGKYIPHTSIKILQENEKLGEKSDRYIHLKGAVMGNALIDPIIQRLIKTEQSFWTGLMSQAQKQQVEHLQGQCIRQIQQGVYEELDSPCNVLKSHILLASGIINIYDVRRFDPSTNKTRMEMYLNQPEVRRALKIGDHPVQKHYTSCSKDFVYIGMQPDILQVRLF